MKKAYVSPRTELVLLAQDDLLTTSSSYDIGMGGPSAKDQDWDFD